jgi:hypothetical protein
MSRFYDVEAIRRIYEMTNAAGPVKSGGAGMKKAPLSLRGPGDGSTVHSHNFPLPSRERENQAKYLPMGIMDQAKLQTAQGKKKPPLRRLFGMGVFIVRPLR